jgi:hypothetical protein
MLLRQISPSDNLTNVILTGLEKNAPALQDIQFYSKMGDADSLKKQRTGSTTSIFRPLNEDNEATPPSNTYDPIAKKIVSFDIKVDRVLEDRNEDVATELVTQSGLEAEDAGWILQEKFFEGNSSTEGSDEFDGLRRMVKNAWIKTAGTNGLVAALGNSDAAVTAQQTFMESLINFFKLVRGGASHCYMNEFMQTRILTIAKNLGYYRQSKDELGNIVDLIGKTIIRGAGYKKNGDANLPFTETVGENHKCSSIFLARWGERKDLSALTSVGCKAVYAGLVGNFYTNNVNMDMALALQNDTALVQVKGYSLE